MDSEDKMLNLHEVLAALKNVDGIPRTRAGQRRMIYEAQGGGLHLDYATFPGGRTEQISPGVIAQLESDGLIRRAFPNAPKVKAWVLTEEVALERADG